MRLSQLSLKPGSLSLLLHSASRPLAGIARPPLFTLVFVPRAPPPSVGGTDLNFKSLNSSNRGPLGMVKGEVEALAALVCWHCRAVGAAVRRAVGDEVPGAVQEETGPTAVCRAPQTFCMCCLYMPLVRFTPQH